MGSLGIGLFFPFFFSVQFMKVMRNASARFKNFSLTLVCAEHQEKWTKKEVLMCGIEKKCFRFSRNAIYIESLFSCVFFLCRCSSSHWCAISFIINRAGCTINTTIKIFVFNRFMYTICVEFLCVLCAEPLQLRARAVIVLVPTIEKAVYF